MSDGMGRELAYLSSHATNRYFIPNWGMKLNLTNGKQIIKVIIAIATAILGALGAEQAMM